MAQVKDLVLRFRQSASADVAANRVRICPANTAPNTVAAYQIAFDEVRPAPTPDADGYCRVRFSALPKAAGIEGVRDVHVTAVDRAGNESDMLEVDDVTFDFSPPDAPTDGAVE